MKTVVGIISDTHGWLDPEVHAVFAGVQAIFHAGDIGHQDVIDELGKIAPVHVVRGNIDGGALRFYPLEVHEEIAGKRISMTHIAGSPKRPNKAVRAMIGEHRPDLVIVGHSHIPVVANVMDTLWVNPGAAGRQGFHAQRFALRLTIEGPGGPLSLERIHFGPRAKATYTPEFQGADGPEE